MPYLVNKHVERLRRHLPTTAGAMDLFEERLKPDEAAHATIPTKAASSVARLVDDPRSRLVILTGDAGHGKTHLCRVVLQTQYGYTPEAAMESLRIDRTGERVHAAPGHEGRPLRIIPDLSELDPPANAAARVRALLDDPSAVGLVCANEGRLRYVVARSEDPELAKIVEALEEGMRQGTMSADGRVHVVNMNYQSVTAPEHAFVSEIVADWAADKRKWGACKNCDAAPKCPIHRNHLRLTGDDAAPRRRREGIEHLMRVMERAGQVMTIRDTLSLCAYMITGSLDCHAVAERDKHSWKGRTEHFAFEQILFEPPKSGDVDERLPALAQLRRMDPGHEAIRELDEALAAKLDEEALASTDRKKRNPAPPKTIKEARKVAEQSRTLLRHARRREFFELECTGLDPTPARDRQAVSRHDEFTRARKLGFRHYAEFAKILEAGVSDRDLVQVRDRVIDGLHVVQGIRPRSDTHFLLTDPAFARAGGRAPVVARQIPRQKIRLTSLEGRWSSRDLASSIDWLPRLVVVAFGTEAASVELDLQQFEFLLRAAGGVTFREFHSPTIRRILRQLARLTTSGEQYEIRVVDGASVRYISVDHGTFKVSDV